MSPQSTPAPHRQQAFRARLALFAAALCPLAIWLISSGRLARPGETAAWALLCALLMASAPGRWMRPFAYAQLLLLPLTLAWVGAVASTGMGPSIASLESVTAGAYKEVRTALEVVLRAPGFALTAGATLLLSAVAARLAHRQRWEADGRSGLLFLVLLLPASAAVLDAAGLHGFARLAGPEARVSVPWLSHLEMMKASLNQLVMPGAQARDAQPVRSALGVAPAFRTEAGVAVLIIGESLRADALLKPGRGPGSAELQRRLDDGLGVRLPDACAGGNGTFIAVPKLLTAAPAEAPPSDTHRPSLLALARAGGAKTAYINNHEIWVMPETGHDLVQKISSTETNSYDEVATEAVENFIRREEGSPSLAIVLHLYGQHFFYEDRYPSELFEPEPAPASPTELEELRYQRAAEYGAQVLARAARMLDGLPTPAYLVFTSDHGENLPSDHNGKRFHAGPVNSRTDTLVPALVLWNRAFAQSGRQHRLEALQGTALITHHDLARAWLALLGAPGRLTPAADPMTWGAVTAGMAAGPLRCGDLPP